MRVLSVVGARPNFMKLAPVDRALVKRGVEHYQSVLIRVLPVSSRKFGLPTMSDSDEGFLGAR